jgi:hypothetical protein
LVKGYMATAMALAARLLGSLIMYLHGRQQGAGGIRRSAGGRQGGGR